VFGVRASTVHPAAGNGWRRSGRATEGEDNRVGNTIWSIWYRRVAALLRNEGWPVNHNEWNASGVRKG